MASFKNTLLRGQQIKYAFDAISIPSTINLLGRAIDPEDGVLNVVLHNNEGIDVPGGVEMSLTFAPQLWEPISEAQTAGKRDSISNREVGFVYFKYLEYALTHKLIAPHPFEVLPGGLGGVEDGLKAVKVGKNSGLKYMYRISETK